MLDSANLSARTYSQAEINAVDIPVWKCAYRVEKYYGDYAPGADPYEVIYGHGNTLVNGGASVLWQRAKTIAASTSATGAALQAFSTANAAIAVGISTAAVAVTQTDLQAATGSTARYIQPMESGYPAHTDGTSSSGARTITFRSVFGTTEANFAWQEWAVFNDPNTTGVSGSYALGRMLNRKLQSLGTKTTAASWTLTVSLSLS